MFIRELRTRFRNLNISVEIDTALLASLDSPDKISTSRIISINLYKLIYHIGTIQTRRFAPSNRNKFLDKSDLIEKLYGETNDFRVKIDEIRATGGSETLTSISEDFGVGISIIIAESLYNIKRSTIQRIYGTQKRPDWKAQTVDNRILVVECKGSTSQATSNQQERNALIQKTRESGDIKIASLSVLNENAVSTNRFLDPPIETDNKSPEMENHILRAGHYASVFSFFGSSKLSRYYSQMRKRLLGKITPFEQGTKERTYMELTYNAPTVPFNREDFTGHFYRTTHNKYLFVGVDKRLLSYRGFINYTDFQNDIDEVSSENYFSLFKDGVLIIEINRIEEFSEIINLNEIRYYQDNITISDIDEMNELTFQKYINYLLRENGFSEILEEVQRNDFRFDISARKNNITYLIELKLFNKKKISQDLINRLNSYRDFVEFTKLILFTNGELGSNLNFDNQNIVIIDRNKLKEVISNRISLEEVINTMPNNG
ncbi:restriction endonuclease [Kordia jejudonensis]|uniref:restriction endonuclease n=1 Tax=Kordia jejudonensis TaxID=1348245 RepID=UPI0006295B38|nr:restriction endonuclease [Kordia jejudonensis]